MLTIKPQNDQAQSSSTWSRQLGFCGENCGGTWGVHVDILHLAKEKPSIAEGSEPQIQVISCHIMSGIASNGRKVVQNCHQDAVDETRRELKGSHSSNISTCYTAALQAYAGCTS